MRKTTTATRAATKKAAAAAPKGRIVAASASMTGVGSRADELNKQVEKAMIEATEEASRKGITDPKKIVEMKLAARDRALEGGGT